MVLGRDGRRRVPRRGDVLRYVPDVPSPRRGVPPPRTVGRAASSDVGAGVRVTRGVVGTVSGTLCRRPYGPVRRVDPTPSPRPGPRRLSRRGPAGADPFLRPRRPAREKTLGSPPRGPPPHPPQRPDAGDVGRRTLHAEWPRPTSRRGRRLPYSPPDVPPGPVSPRERFPLGIPSSLCVTGDV